MRRKIGSIFAIAGLVTVSMTGLGTPAHAQDRQACREACKEMYGGGQDNQDYLDCVEICSQFNPVAPGSGPDSALGVTYYKPR